jgi:hypothetical protein
MSTKVFLIRLAAELDRSVFQDDLSRDALPESCSDGWSSDSKLTVSFGSARFVAAMDLAPAADRYWQAVAHPAAIDEPRQRSLR